MKNGPHVNRQELIRRSFPDLVSPFKCYLANKEKEP